MSREERIIRSLKAGAGFKPVPKEYSMTNDGGRIIGTARGSSLTVLAEVNGVEKLISPLQLSRGHAQALFAFHP